MPEITWPKLMHRVAALVHAAYLCYISSSGCAGVEQVEVISEDGSPHGPKCFVLWNPPLTVSQQALNKGSQMKMSRTEGRARLTKGGISKWVTLVSVLDCNCDVDCDCIQLLVHVPGLSTMAQLTKVSVYRSTNLHPFSTPIGYCYAGCSMTPLH